MRERWNEGGEEDFEFKYEEGEDESELRLEKREKTSKRFRVSLNNLI